MSIRFGDSIIAGGGMPINKSALYLFDFKWSDHLVNQQEWLRADTFTWHDGTVYQNAYQHLVDDIDGKTLTSETIGTTTIQFYLADDGHKICPETEEANVGQIFLDAGVAWYYILDQTNTRFKLPRTEFGFVGVRGNVGDYIEPGLPDHTHQDYMLLDQSGYGVTIPKGYAYYKTSSGAMSYQSSDTPLTDKNNWHIGDTTEPIERTIYGNSTTVQPPATQMYLYFYIGEFTQTATQNTAGLNAELFNSKADLSMFQVVTALPANPDPNVFYFIIPQ